eukprot:1012315-Rhodomonas_salina.2
MGRRRSGSEWMREWGMYFLYCGSEEEERAADASRVFSPCFPLLSSCSSLLSLLSRMPSPPPAAPSPPPTSRQPSRPVSTPLLARSVTRSADCAHAVPGGRSGAGRVYGGRGAGDGEVVYAGRTEVGAGRSEEEARARKQEWLRMKELKEQQVPARTRALTPTDTLKTDTLRKQTGTACRRPTHALATSSCACPAVGSLASASGAACKALVCGAWHVVG